MSSELWISSQDESESDTQFQYLSSNQIHELQEELNELYKQLQRLDETKQDLCLQIFQSEKKKQQYTRWINFYTLLWREQTNKQQQVSLQLDQLINNVKRKKKNEKETYQELQGQLFFLENQLSFVRNQQFKIRITLRKQEQHAQKQND